jgi:hypothetical protein
MKLRIMILTLALAAAQLCRAQETFDPGQISSNGLSRGQARVVLLTVLKQQHHDPSKVGMSLEALQRKDSNDPHPGYFDFGLSYDSPNAGATQVLGAYAVSRYTGDVWETNLCKRFSSRDLKKLQKMIMEKTRKSFSSERTERAGLGCSRN